MSVDRNDREVDQGWGKPKIAKRKVFSVVELSWKEQTGRH